MGTTANRSWPYPESSDFVADGATAIENLADAIDGSIGTGYVLVSTLYYATSGTFTKATYPWLRAVRARVVGGGGGGGGAETTAAGQVSAGGGGGGGGYSEEFITNISGMAASVTVTVGAGGAGSTGSNGTNAGDSSFGSYLDGNGGDGGSVGLAALPFGMNGAPGAGGTGTGGNFSVNGQSGEYATGITDNAARALSGAGGHSLLGFGGPAAFTASRIAGTAGQSYGGGGSGAAAAQNNANTRSGGNGADGVVILELYA